jgi:DNA recombination protein RmuC
MEYIIGFIIGLIVGIILVLIISFFQRRNRAQDINTLSEQMKNTFSALSFETLTRSSDELIKRAEEILSKKTSESVKDLEEKKKLIDQKLQGVDTSLQRVESVITQFEKDRAEKFGQLDNQLKEVAQQTGKLQETTGKLQIALSSSKVRGQWGERMAEDVLRLAGFVEGINYQKQVTLETSATRPDYTFFLPQGLKLNMDVKFPWTKYWEYFDAISEVEKDNCKTQFLKDVKQRIKEVTTRDYINPAENTVDYVLVFIPNEQVYCFIYENDSSILDEALKNKVILCSPMTLYAILAVIRQAVDNFNLERTAGQILSLIGAFNKQWKAFCESLEKMGRRIEDAHEEYNKLISTRRRQLERPLQLIDDLRTERGIVEALLPDSESISADNPKENGN